MTPTPIPLTAIIEAHQALESASLVLCHQGEHKALSTRCAEAAGTLRFYVRANSPHVPVRSEEAGATS